MIPKGKADCCGQSRTAYVGVSDRVFDVHATLRALQLYPRTGLKICHVPGAVALDSPYFLRQGLNGIVNLFRRVLAGYKEAQPRGFFRYCRIQNWLYIYPAFEHCCRYTCSTE